MGKPPDPPGDPAAYRDPVKIDHGGPLADSCETAEMFVAKRSRRSVAAQAHLDRNGDMSTLLFGGWRDPRHRLTVPSIKGRGIADDKDLRITGSAKVRRHFDAVRLIGRHTEPVGSCGRAYAGRPEDDLRRYVPVPEDDTVVGAFADRPTEFNFDSQPLERGAGIG